MLLRLYSGNEIDIGADLWDFKATSTQAETVADAKVEQEDQRQA